MKFTQTRAFKYVLGFTFIGLLITLLIAYVERTTLATYQRNLSYLKLSDNVKAKSAQANLLFEKLMTGDQTVDFEKNVISLFSSSQNILNGAYTNSETSLGKFGKIKDDQLYSILKEAFVEIETATESARKLYAFKKEVAANVQTDSLGNVIVSSTSQAISVQLDNEFDKAYEKFQTTVDRLENRIKELVKKDSDFLNSLSWISIVLVVGAFALLGTLIYKIQLSNDKTVAYNDARLQEETNRMDAISTFIEGVSSGNYAIQLVGMSETEGIGNTLVNMRNKLNQNAETDRRDNWSTSGLAQIGDILRTTNTSTSILFDNIIRFVVKYTGSNQGGLFIYNEEDELNTYLELVACYAFERKKFLNKRIDVGEGLVGQCFVEGEKIYLLDVPEEYITITSGLGGSNPSALLLMPMKVNDKIYGVIELASFKKFEDFEINLIEKLAESIASTISNVRTNESTRVLLEKTQQQAEEMRAQEEEMRQNMEELEATQEEMRRKEKHLQDLLDKERSKNKYNE